MKVQMISRKVLSGHLLAASAKGMCSLAYTSDAHKQYTFIKRLEPTEYVEGLQDKARKGALCAHFCVAGFERVISGLTAWGIVSEHRPEVFRLLVDADDIPKLVTEKTALAEELFAEAVEAFLNFEAQHGWPENYFSGDLVTEFRESGLLEVETGSLNWTPEMLQYFNHVVNVPWDADELFGRICTSYPK